MSEIIDERRSPDTLLHFDMEGYYSESSDEDEDELEQYIDKIKEMYIDKIEKIIDSKYDIDNIELLINIIEESYYNEIDINDSNMKNLIDLMYIFYDRTRFNYINHIECIKEIFKNINTLNDIEKINIDKEIKDMFDKINSIQITPNISVRV